MPKDTPTGPQSVEQKLDTIIDYMDRMNARDRWRTFGGFIRALISLVPIILLVWSTWYFIVNRDEIMKQIVTMSAQAAQQQSSGLIDNLKAQYGIPK